MTHTVNVAPYADERGRNRLQHRSNTKRKPLSAHERTDNCNHHGGRFFQVELTNGTSRRIHCSFLPYGAWGPSSILQAMCIPPTPPRAPMYDFDRKSRKEYGSTQSSKDITPTRSSSLLPNRTYNHLCEKILKEWRQMRHVVPIRISIDGGWGLDPVWQRITRSSQYLINVQSSPQPT